MTDTPTRDETRIDTAALRARLSAVAHGSDRPYAASVAKDAFGALSILLDEIDRLRAENEMLRENHEIVARIWRQLGSPTYEQLAGRSIYDLIDELKAKAEPPRLRSKIVSRDIPITKLPEAEDI